MKEARHKSIYETIYMKSNKSKSHGDRNQISGCQELDQRWNGTVLQRRNGGNNGVMEIDINILYYDCHYTILVKIY